MIENLTEGNSRCSEKRNQIKGAVKKAHQKECVSNIENNIHGRQKMGYKTLILSNNDERDNEFNTKNKEDLITYHRSLWYEEDNCGNKQMAELDVKRFG